MNLVDFVLTYADADNKPICTIEDYYDKYVIPLNDKFKRKSSNKRVCCFHDDINPSMGLIPDKHLRGVFKFHCFGCGKAGSVVDMHQLIQKQYHKRHLTTEDAAKDLAKLYEIPLDSFSIQNDLPGSNILTKEKRLMEGLGTYSFYEFSRDIKPARNTDFTLNRRKQLINNACIKMIATRKKLFED